MLTYSGLDLPPHLPLEAGLPRRGLTRALPDSATLDVEDEGQFRAMSTRHDICAIERTAGNAGSAATLILGTLLLLISP
jgi:hypothetical protein